MGDAASSTAGSPSPPLPGTAGGQGDVVRPRVAVMLSGSGRTLLNLLDHVGRPDGDLRARIELVIASRECLGAERAREAGVPTVVIPGDIPAARLEAVLVDHAIELVALAGYLRLVAIPARYHHRIVNIHPALLPAFGGKNMYGDRIHAAVLAHGCKVTGCTVHLLDEHFDTGPIIAQEAVPVLEDDDAATLGARVFEAEKRVYPKALQLVLAGRVRVEGRRTRILPPTGG